MEADKEKHLPEKASSFSKPTDDNNNENPNQIHNQNQNRNKNQSNDNVDVSDEITNDQVTNDPLSSEQLTAEDVVETTTDNNGDNADKPDQMETKDKDSSEAQTIEEDTTPTAPDLGKVSEEIDKFMSDLSSLKKGDDNQQEPPEIGDFVEQFAVLVDSKIADYESSSTKLSQLTDEDSSSFLESISRISKLLASLSEFSSDSHYASAINRSGAILQHSMSFLEDEFKSILEDYHNPDLDQANHQDQSKTKQEEEAAGTEQSEMPQDESDQPKAENQDESLGYSEEMITQLGKLAKALISGGHGTECYQLYFFTRRKAVEERLQKLGFEKFSIDDVQKMQWDALEREILTWINIFKLSSSTLLPNEKRLAEAVFSHDRIRNFANISESFSRGVVFQLLNFAEAVTMTKQSAEKLFKFLDIYESLRDLIPTMDKLFLPEGLDELKTEASLTRCRLGEVIISIFDELELSIKADTGKTPIAGGAIHPLTRYTINYLKYACDYTETLEQVFREHQKIDRSDSTVSSDFDINAQDQSNHQLQNPIKQSSYRLQIMKVMDLLDVNLEAKSKLYKDSSLSLIFMMNNGRYILQKAKGVEGISSLMGDPWVRKRSSDLRQYGTNYKRETWGRLLNCLNHEGLNVNGKVVKPVLKERFKSFNAMFDEIHRNQSTWVVSDEQLQSELRVSISAIVIPAYRSFMGRFSQVLTPGRQTEKYIKYQPEDIETLIDELFDGSAAAAQGKKR